MRAKIQADVKTAMKAGEKDKVAILRLINAAIQTAEIEAKTTLDDAGIIQVMTKMVKQRRDSIQQYTSGGRPDLADKEQAEIVIIEAVPAQADGRGGRRCRHQGRHRRDRRRLGQGHGQGDGRAQSQVRRADGLPEGDRGRESGAGLDAGSALPAQPLVDSGPVESGQEHPI